MPTCSMQVGVSPKAPVPKQQYAKNETYEAVGEPDPDRMPVGTRRASERCSGTGASARTSLPHGNPCAMSTGRVRRSDFFQAAASHRGRSPFCRASAEAEGHHGYLSADGPFCRGQAAASLTGPTISRGGDDEPWRAFSGSALEVVLGRPLDGIDQKLPRKIAQKGSQRLNAENV